MMLEKTDPLLRVPSLRSLYVFEAAARHLNLVRAAEELGQTQGALSRQIKTLEEYIGVALFQRTPRGLRFTEAGDALWEHCQRAFEELQNGLRVVTSVRSRQSLLIAVARSYSTRVLSHRIGEFVALHPWIELTLDGHRHLANLAKGEADLAIRVGDGSWNDAFVEKLGDDPLVPVIAPALATKLGSTRIEDVAATATFLHFTERNYWEAWAEKAEMPLPPRRKNIRFSETTMMLEAAELAQGIAIGRRSLVADALQSGRLTRMSDVLLDDGIAYYLCYSADKAKRTAIKAFRDWLLSGEPAAFPTGPD
jgi:DNA-binding transcriptional LysR family regulator